MDEKSTTPVAPAPHVDDTVIEMSPTIGKLSDALSAAQAIIEGADKDSLNPHFKSRYADLAAIYAACRVPLASNKIAVFQGVKARGATVCVCTQLSHPSGEWIRSTLTLTAQQNTPQGVGSAITYGRRYGLAAAAGVAPEDDDGEAAEGRAHKNGNGHASQSGSLEEQLRGSLESSAHQNIKQAQQVFGGEVAETLDRAKRSGGHALPFDLKGAPDKKGTHIADVSLAGLKEWSGYLRTKLSDPKFGKQNERRLKETVEELKRRGLAF